MAAPVRLGRKRPLPVCPNPLFVRWLTEWRDEAASRGRRTQFVFQKALRSLRRYPLPLRSGKEAKILRHFGDGLCRMLDQRLQQHRSSGGDRAPDASGAKSPAPEWPPAEVPEASMPVPSQPKAGSSSSYWPARHSGTRAVLLLLYREHLNPSGHSCLTKEELLQRCAQEFPRVSTEGGRMGPSGSGSALSPPEAALPGRSGMGHRSWTHGSTRDSLRVSSSVDRWPLGVLDPGQPSAPFSIGTWSTGHTNQPGTH